MLKNHKTIFNQYFGVIFSFFDCLKKENNYPEIHFVKVFLRNDDTLTKFYIIINKNFKMKKIVFTFLIFASTFAFAQTTRNVGDFSLLKVYDRINAELIPSDKNEVEILGNSDADVETVNKNGELKIRMTTTKVLQGNDTKVKVYYRTITDIQGSQGAIITSPEPVESSMLSLTSNEGSSIVLKINSDKLNVKANSGGEINVSGTAESQDIVVNSGAKFYGKDLDSRNADVTVNAGGFAQVFADDTVQTTTRAGGNIEVFGNPDNRNSKKVVGGKVIFK